jgi:hypothetical protein
MGTLTKCSDDQGFVVLGWLARDVLYARFEGMVSERLGLEAARRLTALVGDDVAVHYFCDNSRITSFDVKAYEAVVEALLAKRDQFELIVTHTGAFPLSARTRSLPAAFRCFELVTTDADFEARLGAAGAGRATRDGVAPEAAGTSGERFSDARGTVLLGWIAEGILYSRFERTITARLAARFAHRFSELVAGSVGTRYFSDSSAVVHYEPRAFAFISDAMLSNRLRFVRIVVRPRTDTVATGKGTFSEALPGLEHITSEAEFVAELRAAAPRGALPPSV